MPTMPTMPKPSRATNVAVDANQKRMYQAITPFGNVNKDLTQALTDSEAKLITTLKNQSLQKTTL